MKKISTVFNILILVFLLLNTASAEFLMKVDEGKKILGNLIPSFYGGVIFKACDGEKWTINGGNFTWTDKKCEQNAKKDLSRYWGNPFLAGTSGGTKPKPRACPNCNEGPDILDLIKKIESQPCESCPKEELYRLKIDTKKLYLIDEFATENKNFPNWNQWKQIKTEQQKIRMDQIFQDYNFERQFLLDIQRQHDFEGFRQNPGGF